MSATLHPFVPRIAAQRASGLFHRFASVDAHDVDELVVLAVRNDDEEPNLAESFVLRVGPDGVHEMGNMPGALGSLAWCEDNLLYALDPRGFVHVHDVDGWHVLPLPRPVACCAVDDRLAVGCADGSLWRVSPTSVEPVARLPFAPTMLQASSWDVVAALGSEGVALVDVEHGQQVSAACVLSGATALTLDDDGNLVVAANRTLLRGTPGALREVAQTRTPLASLAWFRGQVWAGSVTSGLWRLDERHGMIPVRPSLRAHTLRARGDVLAAAGDVLVGATRDGVDFVVRDLTPFVRLSETRKAPWSPDEP